ncbi:MAG: NDP-sugar synthase [Candidatus Heimdallarchaeota archaeon]|nr:MAG: NDP-sugar synthase [Candidatus Heimdallarchaeota archaeon]
MDDWSAIVLAGGVGSRLQPLTTNCPKPMVPVANKPMIDYNLELLKNAGITGKIIIITRYLHQQIRDYFSQNDHFDDLDIILPRIDPLDTADAVRKASNYIDTDQFIVSMADIITNLSVSDFMEFHLKKKGIASITLKDIPYPRAFGVIMLNQNSRILLFLEKPHPEELGLAVLTFSKKETIHLQSNLVNTGIYAFKHGVLDILDTVHDLMDFGKHVFPYLAREYGIFGYVRNYYWMDAGNPQTYLYTNWDVLRRWAFPYFPKAAFEENSIWWSDPKVELAPGARIEPPAAIGSAVEVNKGTIIGSQTVLGDEVIIGENTSINSSVVWDHVKIGNNVNIKESVICNDVVIPSNSKLAPGTVIGPNIQAKKPLMTTKGQIIKDISTI